MKFEDTSCSNCQENCCRNFFILLRDVADEDWIKWLSYHKNVMIKNKGNRDLEVWIDSPCDNLRENGSCSIYESRPQICRNFICGKDAKKNIEIPVNKRSWFSFLLWGKKS